MLDTKALRIPSKNEVKASYSLQKNIAAVEMVAIGPDQMRLGPVLQLRCGSRLDVCGDGFNDRTIKVCSGERYYFVFRGDMEIAAVEQHSNSET